MPPKKSKHSKKKSNDVSDTIESDISSSESENSVNDEIDEEYDSEDIEEIDMEESDIENEELKEFDKKNEQDEDCFFQYIKDNDSFNDSEVTDNISTNQVIIPKEERISINRMTKYEFVRLLGTRTKQLAMGAKPMIKNIKGLSSKEIAILELKHNTTPLVIKRPLPNKKYEIWKIDELHKDHLFD
jgi:DNA-directed RNA polymerase subunit K/omega